MHAPSMWHPLPSQWLGHAIVHSAPYRPGGHTVEEKVTKDKDMKVHNPLPSKHYG